jgi:hypothetical protein
MLSLLFGAPGETLGGVERSLEASHSMKPVFLQTGYGFRVMPETPLRETAVKEGVVSEDDDCFKPRWYVSKDSPAAGIRTRLKAFARRHPFQKLRIVKMMARMARDAIFGVG